MRKELLDINTETNHGVQYVKSKMLYIEPLVAEMKGICDSTVERSNKTEAKVEEFYMKILSLETQKTDLKYFKEEMKDVASNLDKLNYEFDKITNSFKQLENYVEKYQPLRVQTQIHESLIACLEGERPRALLRKHDARICHSLR
jgi:predicted nuclease with TOPRIM domain